MSRSARSMGQRNSGGDKRGERFGGSNKGRELRGGQLASKNQETGENGEGRELLKGGGSAGRGGRSSRGKSKPLKLGGKEHLQRKLIRRVTTKPELEENWSQNPKARRETS